MPVHDPVTSHHRRPGVPMGTGSRLVRDETWCTGGGPCNHPECWLSQTREERGLAHMLAVIDSGGIPRQYESMSMRETPRQAGTGLGDLRSSYRESIKDESEGLPTVGVCNLLSDYGEDPFDRFPNGGWGRPIPMSELPKASLGGVRKDLQIGMLQRAPPTSAQMPPVPPLAAPSPTYWAKTGPRQSNEFSMHTVEVQEVFDLNELQSQWDETFIAKPMYVWAPQGGTSRRKKKKQPKETNRRGTTGGLSGRTLTGPHARYAERETTFASELRFEDVQDDPLERGPRDIGSHLLPPHCHAPPGTPLKAKLRSPLPTGGQPYARAGVSPARKSRYSNMMAELNKLPKEALQEIIEKTKPLTSKEEVVAAIREFLRSFSPTVQREFHMSQSHVLKHKKLHPVQAKVLSLNPVPLDIPKIYEHTTSVAPTVVVDKSAADLSKLEKCKDLPALEKQVKTRAKNIQFAAQSKTPPKPFTYTRSTRQDFTLGPTLTPTVFSMREPSAYSHTSHSGRSAAGKTYTGSLSVHVVANDNSNNNNNADILAVGHGLPPGSVSMYESPFLKAPHQTPFTPPYEGYESVGGGEYEVWEGAAIPGWTYYSPDTGAGGGIVMLDPIKEADDGEAMDRRLLTKPTSAISRAVSSPVKGRHLMVSPIKMRYGSAGRVRSPLKSRTTAANSLAALEGSSMREDETAKSMAISSDRGGESLTESQWPQVDEEAYLVRSDPSHRRSAPSICAPPATPVSPHFDPRGRPTDHRRGLRTAPAPQSTLSFPDPPPPSPDLSRRLPSDLSLPEKEARFKDVTSKEGSFTEIAPGAGKFMIPPPTVPNSLPSPFDSNIILPPPGSLTADAIQEEEDEDEERDVYHPVDDVDYDAESEGGLAPVTKSRRQRLRRRATPRGSSPRPGASNPGLNEAGLSRIGPPTSLTSESRMLPQSSNLSSIPRDVSHDKDSSKVMREIEPCEGIVNVTEHDGILAETKNDSLTVVDDSKERLNDELGQTDDGPSAAAAAVAVNGVLNVQPTMEDGAVVEASAPPISSGEDNANH